MKKIFVIFLISVLVLSGLGAVGQMDSNEKIKSEIIIFAEPDIQIQEQKSIINIENSNSWIKKIGYPLLPSYVKKFTFPFGTKIIDVNVDFSDSIEYQLEKEIIRTPNPVSNPNNQLIEKKSAKNVVNYNIYPEKTFKYNIGSGIDNGEHVIILNVYCYPIHYNEKELSFTFSSDVQINIKYKEPEKPTTFSDEYDLLIVAPEKFSQKLQPLVDHKNDIGISTKLVTKEEICQGEYFPAQGRDCAEELKYFIKDALEQWGIDYVLLVGGRKGGVMQEKWWIPVRYSHVDDGGETSYISDLYYADIYDWEGNFSSWDTNENDIFGEFAGLSKDIIDMYPDLSVGRLPCRNAYEVKIMVDKIITYETTTYGSDWFSKMVLVGGDSAPGDQYYEGEEENKKAIEYLPDFDPIKVWTSDESFTEVSDVVNAISGGCGFLFFDGHGNPSIWSTHPPNDSETWITGLNNYDIPKLRNKDQLPVTVVGGCHNGQFNVSILNIIKGVIQDGLHYFSLEPPIGEFWFQEWVPESWAWRMVRKIGGGSIAIMAYTGLDWFATGDSNSNGIPDCTEFYSGFCNTNFFKNYGVNNLTILGQAHSQTLTDYIDLYPPMDDELDCKTVQEFTLIGDPSLQIGGYE